MAYTKHTWLARLGTGLNKYRNAGTVQNLILTQTPDNLEQEGTPFSAGWMNEMEDGIEKAYPLGIVNVIVPVNSWIDDTQYSDYPYRASLSIQGITNTMIPVVIFDTPDAISGMFAPVSKSYDGGIYIYASQIPENSLTIPTILILEAR